MFDQQFSQHPDLPCGMLTGGPDKEYAGRRDGIARHHRDKSAGIEIVLDEMTRQPSDAEPRYRGSGESGTVVRLEPPLRMNGDCLVAIDKLPGFRSLH